MTITEQSPVIAGHQLHRLLLSPKDTPRGGLLFFHGQGDFIDRYPPILKGFVNAGYQCLLTDLPGHGRSSGKRGAVPGLAFLEELFQDSLANIQGPLIISGHSMGGLIALSFLLQNPDRFRAAWLSSPLLDPMRQAAPWMRCLLPIVAGIAPRITVGTGVRTQDCGDMPAGRSGDEKNALYHSRISIGWGRDLRDKAEEARSKFPNLPTDIPILFTQGKLDNVCPAQILEDRLANLPENKVTLELIPEARHEPFSGSTEEEFLTRLNRWISANL